MSRGIYRRNVSRVTILFAAVVSIMVTLADGVAQAATGAVDPVAGTWGISTQGQAQLGTPSGACDANGLVTAAFNDSIVDLSDGSITIHNLGISIGATSCTSVNFQGTGSYSVTDRGDGNFEVNGTFTPSFVGSGGQAPLACSGTVLTNVAFSMSGKTGDTAVTITFNGLASGTYAESPAAPAPISCTAPILNLNEMGTATKFQAIERK